VARYVQFPPINILQPVTNDIPGNVSRDQTELNPRAEMICHQEMREIADQSPDEMPEPNNDATDQSEVTAGETNHGTTLGQAEQRSKSQKDSIISASGNDMVIKITLQSHTKQWPVLRYVGIQDDINHVQLLTSNHELGRAEQLQRAEPGCTTMGLTEQPAETETKLNTEGGEMSDQPRATTGEMSGTASLDQAEQESSYQKDDIISASSSALFTRNSLQCHTKKWPVLRYVGVHNSNDDSCILTHNSALEVGRDEQTTRAEPGYTARGLTERFQMEGKMTCQNPKPEFEIQDRKQMLKNEGLKLTNKGGRLENTRMRKEEQNQEDTRRMERPNQPGGTRKTKIELKQSWKEIRESTMQLKTMVKKWEELEPRDTRRLEKEDKKLRQDLIDRKKKKFGRAGKAKLTELEEALISSHGRKRMELEEIKLNLAKEIARREGWKTRKMSEKKEKKKNEGKKMKGLTSSGTTEESELARRWQFVSERLDQIEKEEVWIDANRLERSSQEEQRSILTGKAEIWEQEQGQETPDKQRTQHQERALLWRHEGHLKAGISLKDGLKTEGMKPRFSNDLEVMAKDKMQHHQASVQWDQGVYMKAGLFQRDGNARGTKDTDYLDTKYMRENKVHNEEKNNHDKPSDNVVVKTKDDRKIPKASLEDFRQEDKGNDDLDIVMFGRNYSKRKKTCQNDEEDAFGRTTDPMIGNLLLGKDCEMHTTSLERSAPRLTTRSEMHCQERSILGGRVVKTKRGTPAKQQKVKNLRKLFENPSSPGKQLTRGSIELLLQSTLDTNPLILGANHTSTEHTDDICADQPEDWTETGPRQTCGEEFRPEPDWSIQTRLGLDSQPICSLQTQTLSQGRLRRSEMHHQSACDIVHLTRL
jgi:hypothetical protein